MGQGQEVKTRNDPQVEIQERGRYSSSIGPRWREKVQRLYIVLRPKSSERPVEEKQDPHSGKEGSDPNSSDKANVEGGHGSQVMMVTRTIRPDQHDAGPSQFMGLQSKRKAVFPAHLQGQFGQLRYSPADPPDFLNYEGCELLLITASDDIEEELGLELKAEGEADPSCSDLLETFGETAPVDALLRGAWV